MRSSAKLCLLPLPENKIIWHFVVFRKFTYILVLSQGRNYIIDTWLSTILPVVLLPSKSLNLIISSSSFHTHHGSIPWSFGLMAPFKERSFQGQIFLKVSALTGQFIFPCPLEMRNQNKPRLDTDDSLGIEDVKLN